jgi:hypothetical protein
MCAFTVEIPLSYSVAVVTFLWPFVQPFWRDTATFLSRLLIEIQLHQHRRCSTLHQHRGLLVHRSRTEMCIHQQQTRWMIHIVGLLSPTASYCRVMTVLESLRGPVIMHGVWPLHSPDILVGMFRRYTYKTSAHSRRTKKHLPRDCDSFRARTPEGEQQLLPQLY